MTIVASGSVAGFFREVVEEAIKSQRVPANDGTTSYVVSLLADYAKPDPQAEAALDRPLTLLLDEALHTPGTSERFQRLRMLGDGVLYTTGFFGDHFEARGVDQKYVVGIGVTAYHAASTLLGPGAEDRSAPRLDVLGELASTFERWVNVLSEVADATIGRPTGDSRGLLKAYERWLKTGSSKLAEELTHHGLVPMRHAKGVQ
ncbi:MAG: hypothetical protein IPG50_09250 [Myxococcales bacterium]|nr:hypothetical protein [Myxococcales bacterium]